MRAARARTRRDAPRVIASTRRPYQVRTIRGAACVCENFPSLLRGPLARGHGARRDEAVGRGGGGKSDEICDRSVEMYFVIVSYYAAI